MKKTLSIWSVLFILACFAFGFVMSGCDDDDDDDAVDDDAVDDDAADDDAADDDAVDDDAIDDDATDDDAVDDDATDDDAIDDDATDDDTADDDDTALDTYSTDDGTAENNWTVVPAESMFAKVFTPVAYPSYLTDISFYLTSNDPPSASWGVVVYQDANGGSPEDATQVLTNDYTDIPPIFPTYDWYEFDVAAMLAAEPLTAGTWVIGIIFHNPAGTIFLGADESSNDPDSWIFVNDGATGWTGANDFGVDGTWMIRGEGWHYL